MYLEPSKIDGIFFKNFNMDMNIVVTITLTCCVLYNLCEIHSERVSLPEDIAQYRDPCVRVQRGAMKLSSYDQVGKIAREHMRMTNFESLVARNPSVYYDRFYYFILLYAVINIVLCTSFLFGYMCNCQMHMI